MDIFDFVVDTQNATQEDFDNAVDFLRYMDARTNWSAESYSPSERPPCIENQPLTAEEYENWIKAVFVFIERCPDFYPPGSNFAFPYRKYNMVKAVDRFLEIYIVLSYMKSKGRPMLTQHLADLEGRKTQIQNELSLYINTSQFIRAFILAYHPVVHFEMNNYKDFGAYIGKSNTLPFFLTHFPFDEGNFVYDEYKDVSFVYPKYILRDGKLYEMKNFYSSAERMKSYFETHSEIGEKIQILIADIKKGNEKMREASQLMEDKDFEKDCRMYLSKYVTIISLKELLEFYRKYEKGLKIDIQNNANRLAQTGLFYTLFKRKKDEEGRTNLLAKQEKNNKLIQKAETIIRDYQAGDSLAKKSEDELRDLLYHAPDFLPYEAC